METVEIIGLTALLLSIFNLSVLAYLIYKVVAVKKALKTTCDTAYE